MKLSWSCVCTLAVGFFVCVSPAQAVTPPAVGGHPSVDPSDFRVTVFAEGLNFPFGMLQLSDGSLIVATDISGGFGGNSQLLRFTDINMDGVADGPAQTVYGNGVGVGNTTLPGPTTMIREAGDLLLVTGSAGPITVLRTPTTPGDPYEFIGQINMAIAGGGQHNPSAIAVRETPDGGGGVLPNTYDVVFQFGAETNTTSTNGGTVTGLGLNSPIVRESLYMFTIVDHGGGSVSASNLLQLATGVRNGAGILFHPNTGDMYFQDNGIDGFINGNDPESADEINVLPFGNIGGPVEDYGFVENYIKYDLANSTNVEICNGGTNTAACDAAGMIDPIVTFQPINPPNGSRSEGPSEIAWAPSLFPAGLNNGIFVTFHGRNNTTGLANIENPLVFFNLSTNEYFHFISNDETQIGHIDGIHATANALFLADLSSQGTLGSGGANSGVIYMIMAIQPAQNGGDDIVPEPATVWLLMLCGGMMLRRRTR